jgi:hypothetical protein
MNEITRFDLDMDGSMEPSEHGRWVRYEDAQRTWVGLTDEEILSIFATCHKGRAYPQDFYSGPRAMRLTEGRAIEATILQALAAQRQWVGLTETEVDECYESVMFNPDTEPTRVLVYQAIEAKLKERNV